ncbi:hypothetical protein JYQ62_15095 [Nostoc sp. UHCC 0702]|nr:hypothetical protein JYQ62_15095 [Nostoc sp. UHCC 0702]
MATIIGIDQPETLIGTIYNDNIKGKGGDDTLIGDSGNDTLDGGTGNDSLSGGSGNDTYIVDSTADIVSEDNGNGGDYGGVDTVKSSVDWTLGTYLENLTLTDTTAINGNGNALNNWIKGNSASNILSGGDGNDSILGEAGDDTIYGGAGDDKLSGGNGNDYLAGDEGNNSLCGGAGNDRLDVSYSSGNNLLDGGLGSDSLYVTSSSGNNTLKGGTGNDNLYAYYSKGNNLLIAGDGNDSLYVDYSRGNNTLIGGDGNDQLGIYGSSGNNTVNGGNGDDTLYASNSSGSNTLIGGDGNDLFGISYPFDSYPTSLVTVIVNGGTGYDSFSSYFFNVLQPIVTTLDTTTTSGTIKAGNYEINFQNIEAFSIIGTDYSDSLLGGNGNDDLDAGSGSSDTIKGGAGDDTLSLFADYNDYSTSSSAVIVDGGTGYDFLNANFYNASEGIVTTLDSTTTNGTIKAGNYQISFQSIEYFRISGSSYSDSLLGGNGNDYLNGSYGGNDTINGGAGNDSIGVYFSDNPDLASTVKVDGGTENDILSIYFGPYPSYPVTIVTTLDPTTNSSTITDGVSEINFQNIEGLSIIGTLYSDSILSGNGNDYLQGGDGDLGDYNGNDTLNGGAGNDTLSVYGSYGRNLLIGGDGNDLLTGGDGVDTFIYSNYTEGVDTINNFNTSRDLIQVSANGFGGGLVAGSLLETQFVIGTAATSSAQRFIYDDTTGALYFDLDGSDSGFAQRQLAQITGGVSLSASNFTIV